MSCQGIAWIKTCIILKLIFSASHHIRNYLTRYLQQRDVHRHPEGFESFLESRYFCVLDNATKCFELHEYRDHYDQLLVTIFLFAFKHFTTTKFIVNDARISTSFTSIRFITFNHFTITQQFIIGYQALFKFVL